jgi:hypothetical protein
LLPGEERLIIIQTEGVALPGRHSQGQNFKAKAGAHVINCPRVGFYLSCPPSVPASVL